MGEQTGRRHEAVGWGSIPDLQAVIRHPTGAACHVQAAVLRWLLDHGANDGVIECPNYSRLAALVGEKRQSVQQAMIALAHRRLIQACRPDGPNGKLRVTATVPETRQLSLFAGPG